LSFTWFIFIFTFSLFLYLLLFYLPTFLPFYFFTFLPFYKVPKVLQDDDCQNEEQEQVKSFPSEEVSEGEPCLYVLVQIIAIISYHGTTDDDA
jgi:hypothetical protein